MLSNWFLSNKLGHLGRVSMGSLLLGGGPLTPASVGMRLLVCSWNLCPLFSYESSIWISEPDVCEGDRPQGRSLLPPPTVTDSQDSISWFVDCGKKPETIKNIDDTLLTVIKHVEVTFYWAELEIKSSYLSVSPDAAVYSGRLQKNELLLMNSHIITFVRAGNESKLARWLSCRLFSIILSWNWPSIAHRT